MLSPSDTAISIAHAVIFFSTIGCIVYVLFHWNQQETTSSVKMEDEQIKDPGRA